MTTQFHLIELRLFNILIAKARIHVYWILEKPMSFTNYGFVIYLCVFKFNVIDIFNFFFFLFHVLIHDAKYSMSRYTYLFIIHNFQSNW